MVDITEETDIVQYIERYIILLLGAAERPIPTSVHLQKELFVLSKSAPKIGEYITYEKHYLGPYSADLNDVAREPVYNSGTIKHDTVMGYSLTPHGREIFDRIVEANKGNKRFLELLSLMGIVRSIYDKLSQDELLFLIYVTYGEYTEYSVVSERLLAPKKRAELARGLLKKGLITEARYRELVE